MSLLKGIVHLYQDVTSLGGTYRIRADRDKYKKLIKANEVLKERLHRFDAELSETKLEIARQIDIVRKHLILADQMLCYAPGISLSAVLSPAVAESAHVPGLGELPIAPKPATSMKTGPATIAGIGAGAVASAGTWGGAELLSNSTATAAGTGASSLVAKSGLAGMSGGTLTPGTVMGTVAVNSPLFLTAVGAITGVAVSTAIAHKRANEISRTCKKLLEVERDRMTDLENISAEIDTLELLEFRLKNEDRVLWKAISSAKQRLLPLGPISHLWRLIRKPFAGSYYAPEEVHLLETLNVEVQRFAASFRKKTSLVPSTAPRASLAAAVLN